MKNHIQLFEEWLLEASGEIFHPKRDQPIKFDPQGDPAEKKALEPEFFDLISIAYAEIGGHIKVQSPADVFKDPDWNYWEGVDIHGSNDFDIVMFGQKTRFGVKWSGVGHDGSHEAKVKYLELRGKDLKQLGFYIEVSGKLAGILIKKYGAPVVSSQKEVEKVLGKPVEWAGTDPDDPSLPGDAWYIRNIGGHPHAKIMLGRPKV